MEPIQIPMDQKVDKANIIYYEKHLIDELRDKYGLLNTKEGSEILSRIRSSQLFINELLKNRVYFYKPQEESNDDLNELGLQLRDAKEAHQQAYRDLGESQQKLRAQIQMLLQERLNELNILAEKEQQLDLNSIRVEGKDVDEILHEIFLHEMQANEKFTQEKAEELEFIKGVYASLKQRQEKLVQRVHYLREIRNTQKVKLL